MRILVYGAGVTGSLYAARLQQAGHDVTVVARGRRLADVREHGLVLEDFATAEVTTTTVKAIERLGPDDAYDLVIVPICRNDVRGVLPDLAANHGTPDVLFLGNSVAGGGDVVAALGRERVFLGFPASGGVRDGEKIRFVLTGGSEFSGAVGELDGTISARVLTTVATLRGAGLYAQPTADIDAWLKTHAAIVLPMAFAVYAVGGDMKRLGRTRDAMVLMVRAVKEGLAVLHSLGVPLLPKAARVLTMVPEPAIVSMYTKGTQTERAAIAVAGHANVARDEMALLAEEFRVLMDRSGLPTPAWDRLSAYLDQAAPPMPEGSAELPLDWRGIYALGAAVAAALSLLAVLVLGARRCCRHGGRCCR
ncbi:MAG: ketopantoate reductase family protein [Anaerolineae bacterium]